MLRLSDPLVLPLVAQPLRDAVLALWSLDARLAEQARAGREPTLRMIRLTWWSEQLMALRPGVAPAEPLLRTVAERLLAQIEPSSLAALADGWMAEASEEPDDGERGAALFSLTAQIMGGGDDAAVGAAGRGWAMVDRALLAEQPDWATIAAKFDTVRLHRLPRPLAAITAVARRIARHGGVRAAGREQWLLFRVGLLGR